MGRYSSEPDGGNLPDVEPGNYAGRAFRIVDLGTTHEEYDGEVRTRNRVMISFELPSETMHDGRPFSVSLWVTNSLHEKAKLRIVLETWRKRPFTHEEMKRFDLQTIIGVTGMVTVGQTKGGLSKVLGVGPLPKGMECGAAVNQKQTFWLDEFSLEKFQALPDGIQGIVAKSDEYKALMLNGRAPSPGPRTEDHDDDIPF